MFCSFTNDISTDMLEQKVLEYIYPDLEEKEGVRISDSSEDHLKDDFEENDKDRIKIH